MDKFESSVVDEYISDLRHQCYREQQYKESMTNFNFTHSPIVIDNGTSIIKVKGIAKVVGNNTLFYTSKILRHKNENFSKSIAFFKVIKQIMYGIHLNMKCHQLYTQRILILSVL